MNNITSIVRSIRNIMRKDEGVDSDAQSISQMVRMLFGKFWNLKRSDKKIILIKNRNCTRIFFYASQELHYGKVLNDLYFIWQEIIFTFIERINKLGHMQDKPYVLK